MTETFHGAPTDAAPSGVPPCIEPAELVAVALCGPVLILDVRSPQEFASGHIDGAVNIPLDTIGSRASGLPRDRLIVTVCGKGGGRSDHAAQELRILGFDPVRALCRGMNGWLEHSAAGA